MDAAVSACRDRAERAASILKKRGGAKTIKQLSEEIKRAKNGADTTKAVSSSSSSGSARSD